jgi:RNA polymerase sigma-70 factor, ECF subfamily
VTPFESIYRDYFDFVWATVRRLGVSPASVDDVVQDVFVVIHTRLHTLERPEALRSWIYGVARRTVSDHLRSQRVRLASGGYQADQRYARAAPTPLDLKEQSDKVELLWTLLGELEEVKREIFIMAEIDELAVPEIAECLQIPLNTAYSRLRAARQAFRQAHDRHVARERRGGSWRA